jgi:hypothetical protein
MCQPRTTPYLCRLCQRSRFSLFLYLCRAIFLRRFLTTEPILYPLLCFSVRGSAYIAL